MSCSPNAYNSSTLKVLFFHLFFFIFSLQEIIAETTEKLQETIAQKEKTQRALDCTRTVLHKTEGERAEQVMLKHY